jgi:hypothetical protein
MSESIIFNILGLSATVIGGIWILLKMSVGQYEKRVDEKFRALSEKLSAIDKVLEDVRRIELDNAKRETEMMREYVLRRDFLTHIDQQNQNSKRIYELLEQLSQRLEGKVDKADCKESCLIGLEPIRLRRASDKKPSED